MYTTTMQNLSPHKSMKLSNIPTLPGKHVNCIQSHVLKYNHVQNQIWVCPSFKTREMSSSVF